VTTVPAGTMTCLAPPRLEDKDWALSPVGALEQATDIQRKAT